MLYFNKLRKITS